MTEFIKYPHLERLGNTAVEGILDEEVYVFPKLDGTNGSVWLNEDGEVTAGSRNRELSADDDNRNFYKTVTNDLKIKQYLEANPNDVLYGEWLVPHTFKGYQEDAWGKFYIFDIFDRDIGGFVPYNQYYSLAELYSLNVIPPLWKGSFNNECEVNDIVKQNTYLTNGEVGEGIVIKRYNYENRFGRVTWAKVINQEFKSIPKVNKERAVSETENKFACDCVTTALVEKTKAKIENDQGYWDSKSIPRLLDTVFYDIVNEETWDFIKKNKYPSIDFKALKKEVINQIRVLKPEYF